MTDDVATVTSAKELIGADFIDYMRTTSGSYGSMDVIDADGHTWKTKNIITNFTFNGINVFASEYYEYWSYNPQWVYESLDDVTSYDDDYLYLHGSNIGIPSREEIYDPPFKVKRKFKIGEVIFSEEGEQMKAVGFEDVNVPAGYFIDCLKIKSTNPERTSFEWYAKGVGLVYKEKYKVGEAGPNYYRLTEYYVF